MRVKFLGFTPRISSSSLANLALIPAEDFLDFILSEVSGSFGYKTRELILCTKKFVAVWFYSVVFSPSFLKVTLGRVVLSLGVFRKTNHFLNYEKICLISVILTFILRMLFIMSSNSGAALLALFDLDLSLKCILK